MKQRTVMIVWLYMFLLVTLFGFAQEKDAVARLKSAIKMTISTDKRAFGAKEPITVKITVINKSDQILDLPTSPYNIQVVRKDATQVQDSLHGIARKKSFAGDRSFAPSMSLSAGASTTDNENLSDFFVMDHPGVYSVSVTQDLDNGARHDAISSNVLKITVK